MISAHIAARADGFHRGFKIFVDLRIFVFEFNLPAAEFDARECAAFAVLRTHELVAPVVPAQRQIPRRHCAGVEMLMEPLIRRHDDAAWFPVVVLWLFYLLPLYILALIAETAHVL